MSILIKASVVTLVAFVVTILISCGNTSSKRIENSKYRMYYGGDFYRYIWFKSELGMNEIAVPANVLDFRTFNEYVIVARQPIKSVECPDRSIIFHVESHVEYWVLNSTSGDISGPTSSYLAHFNMNEDLPEIHLDLTTNYLKPTKLSGCANEVYDHE